MQIQPFTLENILKVCYTTSLDSKDTSIQNGAVIIRDSQIIAACANNFPPGVDESPHRLERPLKYAYVEHAERGVIYKCARVGSPTIGATLVCQFLACADCARAIALSGIDRVIYHKNLMDRTPDRWKRSVEIGFEILRESNVAIEYFEGVVPCDFNIRFDGKLLKVSEI